MIELSNISKSFGKTNVLKDITLSVNDCSIYGLIGYNGAGKTTLLNIISGLYRPDNGNVKIDADGLARSPFDDPIIKRHLFFVTDEPYYFSNSNLVSMRDFYCGFYPNWSDKSFKSLIGILGLDPNKRIGNFSKGMKRQAAMVLGLSARPRYLLLDESFDGLDPKVRSIICNILTEYIAETEASVIAASHNLYELESICDSVGMINGKNLIYTGDIDGVKCGAYKYRIVAERMTDDSVTSLLVLKNFKREGNICTFVSAEDPEKIKKVFSQYGSLMIFEKVGMTLNEIFIYETEGKENEIEGIFAK